MRPHPFLAGLSVIFAGVVLAACGSSGGDKAGGTRESKPTVLTLANGNGDPGALELYAAAVKRRSGGTLQIVFKDGWRLGQTDYEANLIRDVKAGKADLGWAGTRAFDDVGVISFDALNAPLLIDSLALERKVLESPLAPQMLAGIQPAGVVGLGILPGPLRKPLGVRRLVRPGDYRGETLALQRSQVGEATLEALGAKGAPIAAQAPVDGYDGVEQQISSIQGNRYDHVGNHLTANVTLWPRPLVLFANAKALDGLDKRQRAALIAAAKDAQAPAVAFEQKDAAEATGILCRRDVRFETASAADVAALRRTVQPVYDRLDRDAKTKAAITQIRSIRAGLGAPTDAPSCTGVSAGRTTSAASKAGGKRTPLDGIWNLTTTRAEAAKVVPLADLVSENYGHWRYTMRRGRMYYTQSSEGHSRWTRATYTVKGHIFTFTVTDYGGDAPHGAAEKTGEMFRYRWSRYRDRLSLQQLSPTNFKVTWRRAG